MAISVTYKFTIEIESNETETVFVDCQVSAPEIEPVDVERFSFPIEIFQEDRFEKIVADIRDEACEIDQIRAIGYELWSSLTPQPVSDVIRSTTEKKVVGGGPKPGLKIYIGLPKKSANSFYLPVLNRLPWEALCTKETDRFLATRRDCAVTRLCPVPGVAQQERVQADQLQMVVAVPEKAGLKVNSELVNMPESSANGVMVELMRGRVGPDALADRLQDPVDIVHFIGHGEAPEDSGPAIRLVNQQGSEVWTSAGNFSAMFDAGHSVKLVVLNCCHAGQADSMRSFEQFGPMLINQGVTAVVAMRFAIPDDAAIRFTEHFYKELFGNAAGDVAVAIQSARNRLQINGDDTGCRDFINPILYLASPSSEIFNIDKEPPEPDDEVHIGALPSPPGDLIESMQENYCVAVVGGGIYEVPADRRGPVQPTAIRNLLEVLNQQVQACDPTEMMLAELAPNWLDQLTLERAAEYGQQQDGKRRMLVRLLSQTLKSVNPNDIHKVLAQLPIKDLFYLPLDGLIVQALYLKGKQNFQQISCLTKAQQASATQTNVVLMRGSCEYAEDLKITESDNEKLLQAISKLEEIAATLTLTANAAKASIFFIGVHPRDPVARALASKILSTSETALHSVFFQHETPTDADKAYWSKYNCSWVELPALTFAKSCLNALEKSGKK